MVGEIGQGARIAACTLALSPPVTKKTHDAGATGSAVASSSSAAGAPWGSAGSSPGKRERASLITAFMGPPVEYIVAKRRMHWVGESWRDSPRRAGGLSERPPG